MNKIARKTFGISLVFLGIAGLVLPIIPGIALILTGIYLFFNDDENEENQIPKSKRGTSK